MVRLGDSSAACSYSILPECRGEKHRSLSMDSVPSEDEGDEGLDVDRPEKRESDGERYFVVQ